MTGKGTNDDKGVKPRPALVVSEQAKAEYAAEQAERQNDPFDPTLLRKPSGPETTTPRPSFPVGEGAKAEYEAEQIENGRNKMRPEGLQKPSGPQHEDPRAQGFPVSDEAKAEYAAELAERRNDPFDPSLLRKPAGPGPQTPAAGDKDVTRSVATSPLTVPPSSPAATAENLPAAMPEITQEASAALETFRAKIKDALGIKGEGIMALVSGGDISNGSQLQKLVEKITTGEGIDPEVRRKIIEGINDPARREPTLQRLLDMTAQDHNVLARFNQDPSQLLALEEQVTEMAPVATAPAAAAPVNPIPDAPPPPMDPLAASLYMPDYRPEDAAQVMPPKPAAQQPPHVSPDPFTQDLHQPAAAEIAAAASAAKPDTQPAAPAGSAASTPPSPPAEVSEKTKQLRAEVGAAIDDLLKDKDAKALLNASMNDHDVALFVGHKIGIDLSDFGNDDGKGEIDLKKIQDKFMAMSDEDLEAMKQKIADGKKYLEENRWTVQAFNGMSPNAQHTLATGANALSGFQDKMSEMGSNLMGGLMKNLGSVFNGGQFNIGNLFNGIDIGGMFKQIMGMITGMVSSFSGSESMKGLSNMGGQMMSQLSETLAPVTGQKPGEVVAYNQDGAKIGTPGQPAPGGTAQRRPNDPNAAPNGPGGTTPTG